MKQRRVGESTLGNIISQQYPGIIPPLPSNKSAPAAGQTYPRPIFFGIHYKDTRQALADHITRYNKSLEEKYPPTTKQYTVKRINAAGEVMTKTIAKKVFDKTYSQLAIKASQERTAIALIDMYAAFLKNNAKLKLMDAVFRTNNQAVSTKLNKRTSRVTVWRHISRLIKAGVLQNKKFNGTNASYELQFNPEVLVADVSNELISVLTKQCMAQNPTGNSANEQNQAIINVRACFKANPRGFIPPNTVSFCNHTEHRNYTLEQNINKQISSCSQVGHLAQPVNNDPLNQEPTVPEPSLAQEHGSNHSHAKVPAAAAVDIALFASICWNIAVSIFSGWKKKIAGGYITPSQIQLAKEFIAGHLKTTISGGRPPQHFVNSFCVTLHNYNRFLAKNSYAFLPDPNLYFDPHFTCDDGSPAGFVKSKEVYVNNYHKWKKKNTIHNKRMKLLCRLYSDFALSPTYENYSSACQQLAKLDPGLLDLFNTFITNHQGPDNKLISQLWQIKMNQ